jgi:hypothetical protein
MSNPWKVCGLSFSPPDQISNWSGPEQAGLYLVLVADPKCQPLPFRFVCVGESRRLSDREHSQNGTMTHAQWLGMTVEPEQIWVAFHTMPRSEPEDRRAAISKISSSISLLSDINRIARTKSSKVKLASKGGSRTSSSKST